MTETIWLQEAAEYEATIAATDPKIREILRLDNPFFRRETIRCFVCTQPFQGFATAAITRCFSCARKDGPLSNDRFERNLIWNEIIDAKEQITAYLAKLEQFKKRHRP